MSAWVLKQVNRKVLQHGELDSDKAFEKLDDLEVRRNRFE
jgi:hypothetical protein